MLTHLQIQKWLILSLVLALGILIASLLPYPPDPPRPYMVAVSIVVFLKIFFEYWFGLPMSMASFYLAADDHVARKRVFTGMLFIFIGLHGYMIFWGFPNAI